MKVKVIHHCIWKPNRTNVFWGVPWGFCLQNIAKFTKNISIKSLLNFHSFDLTISLATNQIIHCWLYVKINIIVELCYSAFFSQPFVFESTVYGPCIGEDAGSVYSECGHKNVKHWTCARSYAVTLVADPCMQQRYLQYIAYMAYTYDIFIVE